MPELGAKLIDELDSYVREIVQDEIENNRTDVDTDDIKGLEEFVDDRIDNGDKRDINTDDIEGFTDAVRDECGSYLDDNFERYIRTADVKIMLKDFVREVVREMVAEAVTHLFVSKQRS